MQSNCPNTGCGAAYTLTAQNVGRQFACRECGVMLRVEQDGLRLSAPNPMAMATPATIRPSSAKAFGTKSLLGYIRESVFDWVFGAGAVLVIVFTFFPVLDRLHAMRYHADIKAAETEFTRSDRESTVKLTDDIRKNRDKSLQTLRDKAEDQDEAAKYAAWWYAWGTLIGFLLLAVASIAWMGPGQSRTHRVVAAIVICTELLVVFIAYAAIGQVAARM